MASYSCSNHDNRIYKVARSHLLKRLLLELHRLLKSCREPCRDRTGNKSGITDVGDAGAAGADFDVLDVDTTEVEEEHDEERSGALFCACNMLVIASNWSRSSSDSARLCAKAIDFSPA
jgi:hypothetical protein